MTIFRNDAKGSRGILLTNGSYVIVDPGEEKSVPGDKVASMSAGLTIVELTEAAPRVAEGGDEVELPPPPSSLSQLDHDGDGMPGGSLPHEPPALSGMDRAQLAAQAEKEGILIEHIKGTGTNGYVLMKDIKNAIEAKRAAKN